MQWCCTAVGFAAVQPSETEWVFFFFFSVRWAQGEGYDYGRDMTMVLTSRVVGGLDLFLSARELALGKLRRQGSGPECRVE